ncbi:hypothetical protein CXF68_20295 [Tenacibaculum sp. Bg11-29]|uniref:hypothetical protein n=1 Tax=Tenacibaculum sp. Bg11-29 TaxID=2058306 RepID=UPI000C349EE8|nr:hypothetical protein [Tenacibaculum sp. Bg11-29]PKH52895.1 hypothetical protein CXF68_20295 [Tenacibaculum sp. Bg11-29]
MSETNITHKYILKKEVLCKLNNSSNAIAIISVNTGIKYSTLKRQVKENHEYLTLLSVLESISELLNKPVTDLVTKA